FQSRFLKDGSSPVQLSAQAISLREPVLEAVEVGDAFLQVGQAIDDRSHPLPPLTNQAARGREVLPPRPRTHFFWLEDAANLFDHRFEIDWILSSGAIVFIKEPITEGRHGHQALNLGPAPDVTALVNPIVFRK